MATSRREVAFSYQRLFFSGSTCCCCVPVRVGFIILAVLGIVFGGLLAIILWFEIGATPDLSPGTRATFAVAAVVETLLLLASILGLVGAVVRKQIFVEIYTYFVTVHLLLNIGVAAYLLFVISRFSASATVKACQETVKNEQAKGQCTGLINVARWVYFVVASTVLLIELYAALVAIRYTWQLKDEKRNRNLDKGEAYSLVQKGERPASFRYSLEVPAVDPIAHSPSYLTTEFDPYHSHAHSPMEPGVPARIPSDYHSVPTRSDAD